MRRTTDLSGCPVPRPEGTLRASEPNARRPGPSCAVAVHPDQLVASAVAAAERAAHHAGVRIRQLHRRGDHEAACELFSRIWRPEPGSAQIPAEILIALAQAGGYVAGAFSAGELVGASAGFFGRPHRRHLHSHIAGVVPHAQGRSIGFAMKVYQRAWALNNGIDRISWTFDPLIRRNAHFNVVKLAAVPVSYLPNFYGPMPDAINGTDDSDRILVDWLLRTPVVSAACAPHLDGAARTGWHPPAAGAVRCPTRSGPCDGCGAGADGTDGLVPSDVDAPVVVPPVGAHVRVALPEDIESLRRRDPATATRWRLAVRQVLGTLLAAGGRIVEFDLQGRYLVCTRPTHRGVDAHTPDDGWAAGRADPSYQGGVDG